MFKNKTFSVLVLGFLVAAFVTFNASAVEVYTGNLSNELDFGDWPKKLDIVFSICGSQNYNKAEFINASLKAVDSEKKEYPFTFFKWNQPIGGGIEAEQGYNAKICFKMKIGGICQNSQGTKIKVTPEVKNFLMKLDGKHVLKEDWKVVNEQIELYQQCLDEAKTLQSDKHNYQKKCI